MTSTLAAIADAENEVASLAAVGLGSADAAQVTALAQSLREAGLEGPAREAEKLATLVGPQGARDEQLNAFARLHQMLAVVRAKVAGVEDLSGLDLVEVLPLPSLRVERALVGAGEGLPEFDATAGPAGRYAYLTRAYEWLAARGDVAPTGEGLAIWGDASIGAALARRFEGRPDEAVAVAGPALSMGNVVVRRNAVRVLDRALAALAPVSADHPGMKLLESAFLDGRPLVAHEAQSTWRRLRGLPHPDLDAPYPGATTEDYTAAHRETLPAIAQRDLVRNARYRAHDSSVPIWKYWKMPPSEWTKAEAAYRWIEEFVTLRQYYRIAQGASERFATPRGQTLEEIRMTLAKGKPADQEFCLEFLWLVEDPAAVRWVRPLLFAEKDGVRRRAIVAAGILGDPAVIAMAQRAINEGSKDAPWAVWALAFLGDARAFQILWRAFAEGVKAGQVLDVLPMFGELAAPVLDKIAADPKAATPKEVRALLLALYPGREMDALLYMANTAPPPKGEEAVLRPFAITKKRKEEWAKFAESLAHPGFARQPDGTWLRVRDTPVDPGLAAMQRGLPAFQWMERENARRARRIIELTQESDLDDWTEAVLRRLYDDIHDGKRTDAERAAAVRRLAIVAGEDEEERLKWALVALQAGEAERLSELAFPKKKRKGAKAE